MSIIEKHFYFIKDEFYTFANDSFIMKNKENGRKRPCFLAIKSYNNIIWMIPVSSKVEKFRTIYNKKISKYGYCNTIVLGKLLGRDCAFLIQNMFPITEKYIENQYIQKSNNLPVQIENTTALDIITKFKKVLALTKQGKKGLVFPDIIKLENKLKEIN